MKKIFLLFTMFQFLESPIFSQIKIGKFSTSIDSNANLQIQSSSDAQFFIHKNTGYVGILTLNPKYSLDNLGTTRSTQFLCQDSAVNLGRIFSSNKLNTFAIEALEKKNLSFITNGLNRIMIEGNNGLVGVNTTSPTSTLDVSGNLRVREIDDVVNTQNLKILLSDSSGNFKEITTTNFLDALNIPRQVVSSRVQGNQQIGQINGQTQVLFPIVDLDVENSFQNSVFTANTTDTYTISCMISGVTTGVSASTWWQSMTLAYCPMGSTTWTNVISDWQSGKYFSDINNSNQIYWSGKLNAGDKIRVSLMNTHTQLNNISLGSIVITKL